MTEPLSTRFPNCQPWPVKPPDEHWLKRWHWLRTNEDDLHLAAWTHRLGWHLDWSGRPDPEDMTGWTYVAPAEEPKAHRYVPRLHLTGCWHGDLRLPDSAIPHTPVSPR
jgi:hypothetical protein